MNKKYNIVIVIIIFLVLLGGISTLFYINLKGNEMVEVEATVKMIGDNYIVVKDDNGEEYSLKTEDEYCVGDRVDFVIKDLEENSSPKEGTVVKIDTISRNINFSITDNCEETIVSNDTNDVIEVSATEDDIVAYFTSLDSKFDTYNQEKNIGDSLKEGFITIVDFLFYNGEIKDKTFDELSTSAKIKVLQIAFSIDDKIEKYFPGYKEKISTSGKNAYTSVKSKATELYLDITTKVCENDPDTCEIAKQGLKDLKASFSLTWDFVKEIGSEGLSKLKAWYEIWKEA